MSRENMGRRPGIVSGAHVHAVAGASAYYPPNLSSCNHLMSSRWLAMIWACQMRPMHSTLMTSTQTTRTRFFCDSEAAICNLVKGEVMAKGSPGTASNPNRVPRGDAGTVWLNLVLARLGVAIQGPGLSKSTGF